MSDWPEKWKRTLVTVTRQKLTAVVNKCSWETGFKLPWTTARRGRGTAYFDKQFQKRKKKQKNWSATINTENRNCKQAIFRRATAKQPLLWSFGRQAITTHDMQRATVNFISRRNAHSARVPHSSFRQYGASSTLTNRWPESHRLHN